MFCFHDGVSLVKRGLSGGADEAVYPVVLQFAACIGRLGFVQRGGLDAVHGFALYGSFGNFGLNACRSQFGALGFGFVAAAVCACLDDDGLAAAFSSILTVFTAVSLLIYLMASKSEDIRI